LLCAAPVDVHADGLLRVLRLKEQQLRHQDARDMVVYLLWGCSFIITVRLLQMQWVRPYRAKEADDALLEQARVNVKGAFATRRLLHDHGHQTEPRRAARVHQPS